MLFKNVIREHNHVLIVNVIVHLIHNTDAKAAKAAKSLKCSKHYLTMS